MLTSVFPQMRMSLMIKIQKFSAVQTEAAALGHIKIQTGIDDCPEFCIGKILLKCFRFADCKGLVLGQRGEVRRDQIPVLSILVLSGRHSGIIRTA